MQWLYNINALQYDRLLTILFIHCDRLTFIGNEEMCDSLHVIAYECMGKRVMNQQASVQREDDPSIFQYTFICNERTKHFVREHSFYQGQWQLFAFESLTFWKEEHLVFRISSKPYVELALDDDLEKRIVHLFDTTKDKQPMM